MRINTDERAHAFFFASSGQGNLVRGPTKQCKFQNSDRFPLFFLKSETSVFLLHPMTKEAREEQQHQQQQQDKQEKTRLTSLPQVETVMYNDESEV